MELIHSVHKQVVQGTKLENSAFRAFLVKMVKNLLILTK